MKSLVKGLALVFVILVLATGNAFARDAKVEKAKAAMAEVFQTLSAMLANGSCQAGSPYIVTKVEAVDVVAAGDTLGVKFEVLPGILAEGTITTHCKDGILYQFESRFTAHGDPRFERTIYRGTLK